MHLLYHAGALEYLVFLAAHLLTQLIQSSIPILSTVPIYPVIQFAILLHQYLVELYSYLGCQCSSLPHLCTSLLYLPSMLCMHVCMATTLVSGFTYMHVYGCLSCPVLFACLLQLISIPYFIICYASVSFACYANLQILFTRYGIMQAQ